MKWMIIKYRFFDNGYDDEATTYESGLPKAVAKSIARHLNKQKDGWCYGIEIEPDMEEIWRY